MCAVGMAVEEIGCKELERGIVGDDEGKFFQIRVQLPPQEKEELVVFLRKNIDVFAWSAYEAPKVDPNFIFHHRQSIYHPQKATTSVLI